MPAEQLLNTLLQYYQEVHDAAKTEQILGTTAQLLTQLSNPLNLGVLTSQLLTAPAIWQQHDGLRTSLRVISIYNTAARSIRERSRPNVNVWGDESPASGLDCESWVRAVVKGADEYSKRWRHVLVLTGVLLGMSCEERFLPPTLRRTLEHAVVTAANMALTHEADDGDDGPVAGPSVVLALTYALPHLSDVQLSHLDCDALLPLTIWAMTGPLGFSGGDFLRAIDADVVETHGAYSWPSSSPSLQHLQELERQPLMGNMGPLSKLAAFAAQRATVTAAVLRAQDTLVAFTARVLDGWRANRLSGIDPAHEARRLAGDTQQPYAALWQTLRKLLFAVVATLQAVVARSLVDPRMLPADVAAGTAAKSLTILRNVHFIASRGANSAFQAYTFALLASIDVLGRFPRTAEDALRAMRPRDDDDDGHLSRTLDLFYLNLAEHLPLALSTAACDALIVQPATSYLDHAGPLTPFMKELFESAHSAVLSVLSCPQHSPLTVRTTPLYIVKLLESFPSRISPRQFRLAFKTVMQIVSPPFPIAAMEPHMSETLLEMLLNSISRAATTPLADPPSHPADPAAPHPAPHDRSEADAPASEQSALATALVDALPFLPLPLMEEWLTITAQTLNNIVDARLRAPVKQRFWDLLINGEMDVERAAVGVSWWGTLGGRELFLFGGQRREAEPAMMSGALGDGKISSRL